MFSASTRVTVDGSAPALRLAGRRAPGPSRSLRPRQVLEHLVDLAADLRDGRANRIGAFSMLHADHAFHARKPVGDEERATPDGE